MNNYYKDLKQLKELLVFDHCKIDFEIKQCTNDDHVSKIYKLLLKFETRTSEGMYDKMGQKFWLQDVNGKWENMWLKD